MNSAVPRIISDCIECGKYGELASKKHGRCMTCYHRGWRRGTLVPPPKRRVRNPDVRQAHEDRLSALYGVNFVSVLPKGDR